MNQYYGAYPPQSLTPQQAAALGGWQNNQNLQQMQGMGIQNGYPQQFVQAIPGRMIHDIQEVRPNEVPNNGTVAIFPKDDMSCVYVKYLSNVGKIETMTFVPMAQTAENLPENGELAEIRDKLDEFEREMRDDHGEFPLRRRGEFEHEGRQYGKPYGEYLEARKHYTESHTAMDKAEMERRASEHLTSAMSTIRTIYGDADPDLRKKIKADFTKLVADMPA